MTVQAVLLPLFVQVALTFVLLFWTGNVRVRAVRSGEAKVRDIALRQPNWPTKPTQIANAYENQFETPVLFYVLTILAWMTRQADLLFVVMAWVFVVMRLFHAYVHVTTNHVSRRFAFFAAGAVVLALMWVIYMVRMLLIIL
jgi:hypothetical protein